MPFGTSPYTSCTPKFLHTYVITYGDLIVIVEPWVSYTVYIKFIKSFMIDEFTNIKNKFLSLEKYKQSRWNKVNIIKKRLIRNY